MKEFKEGKELNVKMEIVPVVSVLEDGEKDPFLESMPVGISLDGQIPLEQSDVVNGRWSMLSFMSLIDYKYNAKSGQKYTDDREQIEGKVYLAYCFDDKKIYCVKPMEDDETGNYVLPLAKLGKVDYKQFKAVSQYKSILFKIAIAFRDNYAELFDSTYRDVLSYLDYNCVGSSIINRWKKATYYNKMDSSLIEAFECPFVNFYGYEFNKKLGLMVKVAVEELGAVIPIINEDTEGMTTVVSVTPFCKELYLRAKDTAIGSRIKKIREDNRLSQSIVAGRLGKTQAQISKIESGELEPGIKFLMGFSEITQTSMGHITGEPMADRVGKLIWICKGATSRGTEHDENSKLLYDRYRVLAYNPVSRMIYVTSSNPNVRAESKFKDGNVKTELMVDGCIDFTSISAYALRRAIVGHVEKNDLCQNEGGYPDMLFIPDTFTDIFMQAVGRGYSIEDNTPDLPKGYEGFDDQGRLIIDEDQI